jgi:hypothetical protein
MDKMEFALLKTINQKTAEEPEMLRFAHIS